MLSEEEKKAIDYLQLCYDLSTIDNESLPKLAIILNLIEKQQKEIEEKNIAINKQSITISKQLQEIQELKEENKYQSLLISPYYVAQNYIPKSKIKEINENTDMYYEFYDEVMKLVESEK